jgi:lipopolysaccharide transport system permease protein
MHQEKDNWDLVIQGKTSLFDLRLKEVWRYRDLLLMFVKRDFITVYKQTILGPLWFFIQPILTTLTFMVIFGGLAKIPTDGAPKLVFYMSGITIWNYFSNCLTDVSKVFLSNSAIFGKVYFPRLIMPLTIVISNLMKFAVQFVMFVGFVIYFYSQGEINPNLWMLFLPIILLIMALIAMGIGLILSSMTTKYRDLTMLIAFGVQLFMYATPVIYPISVVPVKYLWIIKLNPLVPIFDYTRYAFLGIGDFNIVALVYPVLFSVVILAIGVIIFNKVQKSFMDTV